jgi:hypothetical protein
MLQTAETLHDARCDDPHAWQTAASLAAGLGIAERTVRARAQSGAIERCTGPGGRSYYRQPRQGRHERQPMAADGMPDAGNSGNRHAAADTDAVQAWAIVVREQFNALETLRASLTAAEVTAASLAATAAERERVHNLELDIARNDRQRAQERAEQTEQALALATARVCVLERLAACSWYAVRTRRQLRLELAELERQS